MCIVKPFCLEYWNIVRNMFNNIINTTQMRNLGVFISSYQIIKGTFLYGDSDAIGIMMHAFGKSICIFSGSDGSDLL